VAAPGAVLQAGPTPQGAVRPDGGRSPPPYPGHMTSAPAPEPRTPKPVLIFDDPLDQQSSDDTDRGWGERPGTDGDSAADLKRFLDEKPPHHL
jgi:hypothetical protein